MLKGEIRPVSEYSEAEINAMYSLMEQFYDNTNEPVFRRDIFDKDYCLSLWHETDGLVGFTTQKILELNVNGKPVHGVFSGDTIIHRKHWGETELFRTWARFWFKYAERYDEFYWFLICKGYKTYRILSVFWEEFYPNYRTKTPAYEKNIIDTYGTLLYPDDYNPETGVMEYKAVKDKLKSDVADIGVHELKNKDTEFFCRANPDYISGNDIACLARLDKSKMKKRLLKLLFP